MSQQKFKKYKEIKEKLSVDYKGYALGQILSQDLVSTVYGDVRFSFKSLLLAFFSLNFANLNNIPVASIFSTMGRYNKRKDYYEIQDYVLSRSGATVKYDLNDCGHKFMLTLKNLSIAWGRIFNKQIDLKLTQKLYIWAKLSHYLNCISSLENITSLPQFKKYLAFSSIHSYETIFTCYFKKRNIKTYSLQHGLYFIFRNDIPLDAIAYENFISDFHFCWGEYTRKEFSDYGIDPAKLLIGGYPRDVAFKPIINTIRCEKCIVFLSRNKFDQSNLALIEVLKKDMQTSGNKIEYLFQLHPTLNRKQYVELTAGLGKIVENGTLKENLSSGKFDFAIGVNTAAYYETYIFGVPCLRFWDQQYDNSIDVSDDIFQSEQDYRFRINQLIAIKDLNIYNKKIQDKLKFTIGLGISNYGNTLKS